MVTSRVRAGGKKQMYRKKDFKGVKDNVWEPVVWIECDPNRTCRIALLQYEDGVKSYILAPEGLKAGDRVISGPDIEPRMGHCIPLKRIPLGMSVHCIEMQPGRGGQICRSARCTATLTARAGG